MDNLRKGESKDWALWYILVVKSTKVFGKMIYAKDKAMKDLQINVGLKVNTKMEKFMDSVNMCGVMEIFMKENGLIIKKMGLGFGRIKKEVIT